MISRWESWRGLMATGLADFDQSFWDSSWELDSFFSDKKAYFPDSVSSIDLLLKLFGRRKSKKRVFLGDFKETTRSIFWSSMFWLLGVDSSFAVGFLRKMSFPKWWSSAAFASIGTFSEKVSSSVLLLDFLEKTGDARVTIFKKSYCYTKVQ